MGGGGGVGGVAEDPAEGGAKVEVEFCGLEWGFQEHGESVELGGVSHCGEMLKSAGRYRQLLTK